MVALEETNKRLADLATRYRQDIHEMYVCLQDAQEDKAMLQQFIASLEREARYLLPEAGNRLTRVIGRVGELEYAIGLERQDGLPDTGSSC
ncbi:hypothetical protein Tco_1191637 [Tanacetum coccineum]